MTKDDIDEFALEIEETIREGRELLDELPAFDMGREVRHGSAVVAVADLGTNDNNEGS